MTSATSLIFIIAGAVMAFVVSYNADAIYIQSLGAAVMAIGGLGLAASILLKPTRLQAQAHPVARLIHPRPTAHSAQEEPINELSNLLFDPQAGAVYSALSIGRTLYDNCN